MSVALDLPNAPGVWIRRPDDPAWLPAPYVVVFQDGSAGLKVWAFSRGGGMFYTVPTKLNKLPAGGWGKVE